MRESDSGKITVKTILSLAFLGAIIFACVKILPVYVNDYQLNDYIQSQTPFWLTQRTTADVIQKNVLAKAQDLDLPLAAENVTVSANANKVSVSVDYHVPVDLKAATVPLHFSHSSGNTAIQ
jgi:hypothetical protein